VRFRHKTKYSFERINILQSLLRISSNRRRWTHIFPKISSIAKQMSSDSSNGVCSNDASRTYNDDIKAILNNEELESNFILLLLVRFPLIMNRKILYSALCSTHNWSRLEVLDYTCIFACNHRLLPKEKIPC